MTVTLEALRGGGKVGIARALARLEARAGATDVDAMLDAAWAAPRGHVLGLTGPPGVGKSTLLDAIIRQLRQRGKTVGVIAVDPSSRASRGALLGDRTRLSIDPHDTGVFVRSMAARDRLGGLAAITYPAVVLMRALFDLVIVETVGVGQSETEVVDVADTVLFCAQPGAGDALQFMKAGVMEIPDIVVVTKSDMGRVATRTATDLKGALSLTSASAAAVPVLLCSASRGEGIEPLIDACEARFAALTADGRMHESRLAQFDRYASDTVQALFGTRGRSMLGDSLRIGRNGDESRRCRPFAALSAATKRLDAALSVGFQQQPTPPVG